MTQHAPLTRPATSARPRLLKRTALFTGAAVTGVFVSAAACYTAVNALFPSATAPAPDAAGPSLAAHVPLAAGVADAALLHPATRPETILQARLAPSAAIVPETDAAGPVDRDAANPLEQIARIEPSTDAAVAPVVVPVTMGSPALVPPARPDIPTETLVALSTGLPERALTPPAVRPAVATLAASGTRPVPRPAAIDLAFVQPAVLTTGIPATRPAPRPSTLAVAMAEPAVMNVTPQAPGARAEPRAEVLQVAAADPAPRTELPTAPRATSGDVCGRNLARAMPSRRSGAATGSAFFAALNGASGSDRDNVIINELARGNMPGFLHKLHPVAFRGKDARGADAEIVICVTPDYLALGSDRDFVRVPLGLPAAGRIAGRFGMTLPTPRMVDAIYAQAEVRLNPAPMTPGPQMSSTAYLLQHNATIESQRSGRSGLISGHKKDVVMASRMASHPGRVAIYGWHRSGGNPIQPVSTVHQASYADYSHGIRLVSRTAYLNGRAVDIDDLLASDRYAYLLNKEGPLPGPVIRIASR